MRVKLFRARKNKSFAVTRITKLTSRVLSIGLLISSVEIYMNAFSQLPVLGTIWALVAISLHGIALVAVVYSAWFTENPRTGQLTYAIVSALILIFWQLQVADAGALPPGFHPWVWWVIGSAAITAALALPIAFGSLYLLGVPVIWYFIYQTAEGGSATAFSAAKDSTYTLLFSSCFSLLLLLLRFEAEKVDLANQEASRAEVERAAIDAVEQERARVDSLVHDKVLTTLLVGANAQTDDEIGEARTLAKTAIRALESDMSSSDQNADAITVWSFFGAIMDSVRSEFAGILVKESGASDLAVPSDVAEALTEATFQAVTNAIQHAGPGAETVVRLKGSPHGVKIVIKDDGRGFRVSRVPKTRLGLRLSIINRVESVGGKVRIDSGPGRGTAIILDWIAK